MVFPKRINKNMILSAAVMAIALATGAAVLLWYGAVDEAVIAGMLRPYAAATQLFYNIDMSYAAGVGYIAPNGAFVIGQGCMGIRFAVMLFVMLVCMFVHRFRGIGKAGWFVAAAGASVLIGVLVSCLRILGSVPFAAADAFVILHTGIGAAFYILAMIGGYVAANKITGALCHEKAQ